MRKASRFYRRPPGFGWLLAAAAVPLLLALIGLGMADRSKLDINGPNLGAPSLSVPGVNLPSLSFAPLSILRNGNIITLNGDLPDISARTGLIDMLKGVFGDGVKLVDNINIKPGVSAPDFGSLGSVFKAAVSMPDFKFKIDGNTVTLLGTAASDAVRAAVEAAAKLAWPNLTLVNDIKIGSAESENAGGSQAPGGSENTGGNSSATAAPSTPTASAPASGDCANLQTDITNLMSTPVTFVTNGYTLSPGTQQQLSRVAEKVKGCQNVHLTVSGYTDNTGNDGINIPLSASRAKSVADYLVANGVPAGSLTSNGHGSADPVASNATPDGRAQNRRVAITVS